MTTRNSSHCPVSDRVLLVHLENIPTTFGCFLNGRFVVGSHQDDVAGDTVCKIAERLSIIHGCAVTTVRHWPGDDWTWRDVHRYLAKCGLLKDDLPDLIQALHAYDLRGFHAAFPPVRYHAAASGLSYWDWVADEWNRRRELLEAHGFRIVPGGDSHCRVRLPDGQLSRSSFPSYIHAWDDFMAEAVSLE